MDKNILVNSRNIFVRQKTKITLKLKITVTNKISKITPNQPLKLKNKQIVLQSLPIIKNKIRYPRYIP